MTDLINKVNELEVNTLLTLKHKYQPVLQFVAERDIPYLAYIINITHNYLQDVHKEESSDWKSWCVVVIKKLFEQEKLINAEEIIPHINKFLEYKKTEYDKYVSNIAVYSDEYFRDCYFIDNYIKQL